MRYLPIYEEISEGEIQGICAGLEVDDSEYEESSQLLWVKTLTGETKSLPVDEADKEELRSQCLEFEAMVRKSNPNLGLLN